MHPKLQLHVRHGESLGNVHDEDARAQLAMSTAEYPLTERGQTQARLSGDYIRSRFGRFDVAFTSHYTRARQTLDELNVSVERVVIEPLIAESQRGIWHTMTSAQVAERYPEEAQRKKLDGLYHYRSLGGENSVDIEMRIALFGERLARDYAGKRVLVIVHGIWQLLFERRLYNQTPEEFLGRYHGKQVMANAGIKVYEGHTRGLWRPRRELCERDYVVPWHGKIDQKIVELA